MTAVKEHYCRLCLSFKTDETFEVIDNVTRDVLNVHLKLKLEESKIYVICTTCSGKLKAALDFKSICLTTSDIICPYIDRMTELQLDLREIYMKEIGNKHGLDLSNDQKVCSLCLQLVVGEFIDVHEEEVTAIHKFVPKMNISIIKDPVICENCFDSVKSHNNFLKDCLEVEKKIECIETSRPDIQSFDLCVKTDDIKTEIIGFEEKQIKFEKIEIKCEERQEMSEASFPSLKVEPLDYTSEWQSECGTLPNVDVHMYERESDNYRTDQELQLEHADNPEEQTYECHSCEYKTSQKRYLRRHVLTHKELMYKCNWCEYKTGQINYLKRHELKHKAVFEDQMYKCSLCVYKTIYKKNLGLHQLTHKDVPEDQMLKCDWCEYKTGRRRYLRQHELIHKDVPENRMHKCNSCDYKTISKSNFTRHQLRHKDVPDEQMYKCYLCDYKTSQKVYLAQHLQKHKNFSREEMYKCDLCDYKTGQKMYFAQHQLRHRDDQMYKCEACEYKTSQKKYLKQHQLIHKEEMYKCDSCDYKSRRKYCLVQHQLKHEVVAEEQTYKCG